MTAPDREVTVTVTPGGAFCALTIGGHDIAHAVKVDHASLTIGGHTVPVLSLVLEVDRIVVKEDDGE